MRPHNPRRSTLLLCFCIVSYLGASAGWASPFGAREFDAVYSDTAVVQYEIDRACLADLSTCLGPGAPTSPCDTHHDLIGFKCGVGIHRFCTAKGHVSGWGVERAGAPDTVDVTCVTETAADTVTAGFGVLQDQIRGCSDGGPSKRCSVAIHRHCGDREGFATGFGPLERGPDFVRVACIRDRVADNEKLDPSSVEDLVPGCSFSEASVSTACRQAMAQVCQNRGADLFGGFGPREASAKVNVGCVRAKAPWIPNETLPESPSRPVDVLVRRLDPDSGQNGGPATLEPRYVHTSLVSNRALSFDGRVLVVAANGGLQFRVHTPEIFEKPISQQQPDNQDRSYEVGQSAARYGRDVSASAFHGSTAITGRLEGKSTAICDPHLGTEPLEAVNRQQSVPGRVSNPFACTATGGALAAGDHDCYDLTVVTVYENRDVVPTQDELWGTEVRVVVASPKGSAANDSDEFEALRAHVVHVKPLTAPRRAPLPPGAPAEILEPVITGDGRLIFIQGDGLIQYAVMPENADPCDVTAWGAFRDIYAMHTDPLMADYGVARFPLRDFENQELSTRVPGTHAIRGGYPWVDRDGDNLMFMLARATHFYVDSAGEVHEKFEVVGHPVFGSQPDIPCIPSADCPGTLPLHPTTVGHVESLTDHLPRAGLTVVGLWGQGKMWSPDSRNNPVDAAIPGGTHSYRLLRLYEDAPGGTEVGPSARTLVNALENQLLFQPEMRPDTPREVVWQITTQGMTDEVSFDDVNDPDALVVLPMSVSIKATNPERGRFQDGFVYEGRVGGEGFQFPAHLANQAAATQWSLPQYGYLLGGARSEPIAAGGYDAKGLWLDGTDDRVELIVPEQSAGSRVAMEDGTWFYNLSIDPRELTGPRRLLTLPDGTWLDIVDATALRFGKGEAIFDVALPSALALSERTWSTIGIVSDASLPGAAPVIEVAIDGYLLERFSPTESLFRMTPGVVTVGDGAGGFRGWVDDFKVIGRAPGPEVLCNHAHGTLVGVVPGEPLAARALAYPASSHAEIAARLPTPSSFDSFACERPIAHPVDATDAADHSHYHCLGKTRRLESHPQPERCLRPALLFPEGPLAFGQSRPSSLDNAFCLSCHTEGHPSVTLNRRDALAPGSSPMHLDLRRQPLQNSPKFFGNVPAFLFDGLPLLPFQTPPEGVFLDTYTAPPQSP